MRRVATVAFLCRRPRGLWDFETVCAILDASVVGEVFGCKRPGAGKEFFEWINNRSGRLVAGGMLLEELDMDSRFKKWRHAASLSGRFIFCSEKKIQTKMETLQSTGTCKSNDLHVLALAQVSGARLLYTNDNSLQQDFRNRKIINDPRGSVYTTAKKKSFEKSHQNLIKRKRWCGTGN